jgi:hypothetical protein
VDPELAYQEKERREKLSIWLCRMLPAREHRVLALHYGLTCPAHSFDEIGKMYGVGRERIRQIEGKAIRRLHHPRRRRKLAGIAPFDVEKYYPENPRFYVPEWKKVRTPRQRKPKPVPETLAVPSLPSVQSPLPVVERTPTPAMRPVRGPMPPRPMLPHCDAVALQQMNRMHYWRTLKL